ncbi:cell wall-binding protein, partial [Fannyhessea vaginae]|uniref:CAP domain-containing protein n=1 Tax=Fannyhessea vaginae TaxID=82135 RepID=UPI00065E429A
WVQDAKGNWLHTDDNGVLATGWFKTKSGYWFYFNKDHTMKTGILTDKGYTFWLDKNDGLLYNQWVKDESGKWLHTDGNGCLVKGWYHAPNGKWFYFNKDNYQMVTGKLTDDHKDYWLDENAGLLYDRWVQDSQGNWLHTDDNGCLVKGWFYTSNGKLFYFNDDYRMVTGELTYKGKIYSLDPQEGLVSVKDIPIRHTQAYEDGAFAFFKAKGATRALEILNKADYASFTNKGNPNDATAVKNMLASIPEMKVCNALRARHGLKPLRVTYELVAMAMSDANWSSSNIAHAQQFNVGENLAWYREKPFTGWYDQEKALYDADPVKNKAAAGHYLNIIRETYECTGFAIATYANNEYRKPCFGQTFLWETNDSKSMTVDEYERELTQWVKSTQA